MSAVAQLERESEATGTPAPLEHSPSAPPPASDAASSESSGIGSSRARASVPTEEQLLDVLYEVLVQGVPPRSTLTREEVEQFLHQHARQTKPLEEMLAFFEQHSLPTDSTLYGADRELGELASGLQKERSSLLPGFGPAEVLEPERISQPVVQPTTPVPPLAPLRQPSAATAAAIENEKTGRRPQPVPPSSRGLRWIVALAAVLAVAAVAAFALDYQRTKLLELRLDQARMQQHSTDRALSKLEQRAESLQGALKQSESERVQQTTQLQTTLEEQERRRATEEQAIERVLGPRYLKLRQKYSDQAAGSPAPAPAKP
ncbi:MAG: hypothetical protein JWN48_5688 [Myxococcaceae bacterium]|nr:hypothetical protein [Myxococcaceae bacterium]